MTSTSYNGRLGNQIIRNLVVSLIAEKHNLKVEYSSHDTINNLGINLFSGTNVYNNTQLLTDDNFFNTYNRTNVNYNLNPNNNYFQTKDITNFIFNYLHTDKIKLNIIDKNKYKERYNNNDLFIHVRLGDVSHYNPGIKYYINAIKSCTFTTIYLSTNDFSHYIIKKLKELYPSIQLINFKEVETIQFASTCKNIILSHGSFSAVIGYLSFFSTVYYPEYNLTKMWYGDIFSIPNWIKVSTQ